MHNLCCPGPWLTYSYRIIKSKNELHARGLPIVNVWSWLGFRMFLHSAVHCAIKCVIISQTKCIYCFSPIVQYSNYNSWRSFFTHKYSTSKYFEVSTATVLLFSSSSALSFFYLLLSSSSSFFSLSLDWQKKVVYLKSSKKTSLVLMLLLKERAGLTKFCNNSFKY
jgi:hypothetical protein